MSDLLAPRFDGHRVVVTGVGRAGQVGESVAREFAQRGASVAIIDMNGALAEERAVALRADGLDVTAFSGDLNDATATPELFRHIAASSGGKIHALANVAGGFGASGPLGESDPALFQRQLAINLGSSYGATRAAMPYLRAAHGAVVFMASAAVLPGGSSAGISAYAAAKAGVIAIMHAVAQEEAGNGVRANALAPTSIRTAANTSAMGDGVKYVERETVAAMIAFLCSPAAVNITGQVITLA